MPQSESDQPATIDRPFASIDGQVLDIPSLGLTRYQLRGHTGDKNGLVALLEIRIGREGKPHAIVSVRQRNGMWTLSGDLTRYELRYEQATRRAPASNPPDHE